MLTALDIIGLVAVAGVFGAMAFFSVVVAPLIFIKLEAATAGHFVRSIFPWYYLVIGGLALAAALALIAQRPLEAVLMALIALGALVSRQVLMPRINRHRDRELAGHAADAKRFESLHRLSVWINTAQMVGVLAVLILLGLS